MTGITITSRDAERIAKAFADLAGRKGLDRIRRKAVNEIGGGVRRELLSIGPDLYGTSAAALQVRGKAASPGSDDPAYRLRFAAKIPVRRLKAKHRKVTRRRGRAALVIDTPQTPPIRFRSVHRDGARFILRRAGPLPARTLGGVYTNAARAFTDQGPPELHALRKGAERDLPAAVMRAIDDMLKRRRR